MFVFMYCMYVRTYELTDCMYVCLYVGTSHDHDQPAHLRVKEELQHVPSGAADPRFNTQN